MDNDQVHPLAILSKTGLFFAVILVFGIIYFYWPHTSELIQSPVPRGSIYMTLLPLQEGSTVGVYKFDVENQKLTEVLSDSTNHYVTSKVSPDGQKLAFARIDEQENMNIFVQDASHNQQQITSDNSFVIRRNPAWSSDGGRLTYIAKKDSIGGSLGVDDWFVYLNDPVNQIEQLVTNGLNPLFTPDGRLLVLKKDGLYLFDISNPASNSSELIWKVEGGDAIGSMKLGLSPDGKYLAWSVAAKSKLLIIAITSWEPFYGEIINEISSTGFWPIFSPDSKYVAFEEIDPDAPNSSAHLVVFDLQTGEKQTLLDLRPYYQESMFITDWR